MSDSARERGAEPGDCATPVADVLQLIVRATRDVRSAADEPGTEDAEVWVKSYRRDFKELWSFWEQPRHGGPASDGDGDEAPPAPILRWMEHGSPRTLVLVWDGQPQSAEEQVINIEDRVTAFDWLVALSQVLGDHAKLRVLLLDIESHRRPGAFACQSFPLLGHLLPWARIYRPHSAKEEDVFGAMEALPEAQRGLVATVGLSSRALLADLGIGDSSLPRVGFTRPSDPAFKASAAWLRDLWSSALTRAETRHDVSNLVAALRLASELDRASWPGESTQGHGPDDQLRAALLALVQALKLAERPTPPHPVPADGERPARPLESPIVARDVFGQFGKGIRFLLVDDLAMGTGGFGYHDVLARFLFGALEATESPQSRVSSYGGHSLLSLTTPAPLVDELWRAVGKSRNSRRACRCNGGDIEPVRFSQPRLLGTAHPDQAPDGLRFDVLFLDLRLFGTEAEARVRERDFYRGLLDFYHRTGACGRHDGPLERAVRGADAFVSSSDRERGHEHEHIDRLPLLPLLLSMVDPSLPIVLFSSTQQRRVVDSLAERRSILTHFAKPLVGGYEEEVEAFAHLHALSRAVRGALELHEARSVWIDLACRAAYVESARVPIVVDRPLLQTKLDSEKKARELLYSVDMDALCNLGREYVNVIVGGRYADALMVPDNWLEGCCGIDVQALDKSAGDWGSQMVHDARARHGSYSEALAEIERLPSNQAALGCVGAALKHSFPDHDDNGIKDEIGTIVGCYLDAKLKNKPVRKLRLHCGSAAESWPPLKIAGFFLDRDPGRMGPSDPSWEFLIADAQHAVYAIARALRNARAHYAVRPDDSQAVREIALWSWIWLMRGAVPMDAKDVLDVGSGPFEMDLWLLGRPIVPTSSMTAVGSCYDLLGRIVAAEDKGWFKVTDDDVRSSLRRIVTLPAASSGRLPAATSGAATSGKPATAAPAPAVASAPEEANGGAQGQPALAEQEATESASASSSGGGASEPPMAKTPSPVAWRLDGLPSPTGRGRLDRRELTQELASLGFSKGARLSGDRYLLEIDGDGAKRALKAVVAMGTFRLCGYEVTLKPVDE